MAEFMRAGGVVIWYVLILCVAVAIASGSFAWKATPQKLALIRGLTWAAVFGIISGVITNFMAVMWKVPGNPEWAHDPDMPLIVMRGLGEAVTPAVLGFSLLSLTWLMVAAGMRRLSAAESV